jgi:signal transduction histidine kinase
VTPSTGDDGYLGLVSRWADDLAHEIKNPLHAMVINLELVKRRAGGDDPAAVIERAEIVESELHRVHDLVDSLLRLVRPWPEHGAVTVDGVFESLLPVFSARARIRKVEYSHSPAEAAVAVAPGTLARLLVTLVDRALDRTPEGGRLSTRVQPDEREVSITVAHTELPDADEPDGGLEAIERRVEAEGGAVRVEHADGDVRTTLILPRSGTATAG